MAGTVVHTPDVFQPIERLRTGDFVLSQPEMGEREARRIVRTVPFEDKAIWKVDFTADASGFDVNKLNRVGDQAPLGSAGRREGR